MATTSWSKRQGSGSTLPAGLIRRSTSTRLHALRRPSRPGIPSPGALIDGQYRVRRVLGEGGMGVVLLAHDEKLQRQVAIKTICREALPDDKARDALLREARALALVTHRNVTRVHAFGELDGLPYIVMEYVPGRTLEDVIADVARAETIDPKLQLLHAVRILHGICNGLSAIHAVGLIHGDVKPSNVLISQDGRVVLTDMGLARLVRKMEGSPGCCWGTPEYMAPEIVLGEPLPSELRRRSDIYSLGVVAFELLTGQLPYRAANRTAMLRTVLEVQPPTPSQLSRELPSAFDALLLRALAKKPDHRIPTASRFSSLLRHAWERARAKRCRLLVADDDADHRSVMSILLARNFPGAVVEAVCDGAAALASARQRPPDVALLDLDMPRMNGLELVAALRGCPATRDTAIVVLTGIGNGADWNALLHMGVQHFFVKPVVPEQLIGSLRQALGDEAGVL